MRDCNVICRLSEVSAARFCDLNGSEDGGGDDKSDVTETNEKIDHDEFLSRGVDASALPRKSSNDRER